MMWAQIQLFGEGLGQVIEVARNDLLYCPISTLRGA